MRQLVQERHFLPRLITSVQPRKPHTERENWLLKAHIHTCVMILTNVYKGMIFGVLKCYTLYIIHYTAIIHLAVTLSLRIVRKKSQVHNCLTKASCSVGCTQDWSNSRFFTSQDFKKQPCWPLVPFIGEIACLQGQERCPCKWCIVRKNNERKGIRIWMNICIHHGSRCVCLKNLTFTAELRNRNLFLTILIANRTPNLQGIYFLFWCHHCLRLGVFM